MSHYVCLLRGVNVGGQKMVRMEALRNIFAGLGLTHVRTYVQSGNVVFESQEESQTSLAGRIEAAIEHTLGYHIPVFLHQAEQLKDVLAHNPFPTTAMKDTRLLHVSFLYREPDEGAWSRLVVPSGIPDKYARGNSVIYLYYPNGSAKSRLPTSLFEKALGVPITDRNWNTVNTLYRMVLEG